MIISANITQRRWTLLGYTGSCVFVLSLLVIEIISSICFNYCQNHPITPCFGLLLNPKIVSVARQKGEKKDIIMILTDSACLTGLIISNWCFWDETFVLDKTFHQALLFWTEVLPYKLLALGCCELNILIIPGRCGITVCWSDLTGLIKILFRKSHHCVWHVRLLHKGLCVTCLLYCSSYLVQLSRWHTFQQACCYKRPTGWILVLSPIERLACTNRSMEECFFAARN